MRKAEINKNFDEIVNFAGVEKFLDTPLKHYSSGMQLRLAFAVAAFLENEILIIDEVLAVGDADFQQKCMGKMGEISKSGRTILFVSHNISAVKNLCNKGIVLNSGEMAFQGNATEAIQFYQTNNKSSHNYSFNEYDEITIGNENIKILSFGVNL
jgi:lipopolysaccharide transport system ATP-binding protein